MSAIKCEDYDSELQNSGKHFTQAKCLPTKYLLVKEYCKFSKKI